MFLSTLLGQNLSAILRGSLAAKVDSGVPVFPHRKMNVNGESYGQ